MNEKIKGYLFGALAAACYGANPLFALHMNKTGISMNSILFYRYIIALFILLIIMLIENIRSWNKNTNQ